MSLRWDLGAQVRDPYCEALCKSSYRKTNSNRVGYDTASKHRLGPSRSTATLPRAPPRFDWATGRQAVHAWRAEHTLLGPTQILLERLQAAKTIGTRFSWFEHWQQRWLLLRSSTIIKQEQEMHHKRIPNKVTESRTQDWKTPPPNVSCSRKHPASLKQDQPVEPVTTTTWPKSSPTTTFSRTKPFPHVRGASHTRSAYAITVVAATCWFEQWWSKVFQVRFRTWWGNGWAKFQRGLRRGDKERSEYSLNKCSRTRWKASQ